MSLQKILSRLRKADSDFQLIKPGDKVAVGLSGGKDSMTLLLALSHYQKHIRKDFDLVAINIDLGFSDTSEKEVKNMKSFCDNENVPLHIVPSNIGELIFDIRKEQSPCSLCSKMRRGALNNKAKELGCNKVALGHNLDDLVETFWLSFIFEGRLSSFPPFSYLDRIDLSVIRPLIYLKEREIKWFATHLPILHNPCPANKHTQRENMKEFIALLEEKMPFALDRMFLAITSPERYNLYDKYPKFDENGEMLDYFKTLLK